MDFILGSFHKIYIWNMICLERKYILKYMDIWELCAMALEESDVDRSVWMAFCEWIGEERELKKERKKERRKLSVWGKGVCCYEKEICDFIFAVDVVVYVLVTIGYEENNAWCGRRGECNKCFWNEWGGFHWILCSWYHIITKRTYRRHSNTSALTIHWTMIIQNECRRPTKWW